MRRGGVVLAIQRAPIRPEHACVSDIGIGGGRRGSTAAAAAPMIDGPVDQRSPTPTPTPRRGVVSIYSLGASDPRSPRAICRQQLIHLRLVGRQGVRVAAPALARGWGYGRRWLGRVGKRLPASKLRWLGGLDTDATRPPQVLSTSTCTSSAHPWPDTVCTYRTRTPYDAACTVRALDSCLPYVASDSVPARPGRPTHAACHVRWPPWTTHPGHWTHPPPHGATGGRWLLARRERTIGPQPAATRTRPCVGGRRVRARGCGRPPGRVRPSHGASLA